MKEKFVIKFDLGCENLLEEVKKAKTVQISNATTEFLKKLSKAFSHDAAVRVLLFPGEKRIGNGNIQFKEVEVEVSVHENRSDAWTKRIYLRFP